MARTGLKQCFGDFGKRMALCWECLEGDSCFERKQKIFGGEVQMSLTVKCKDCGYILGKYPQLPAASGLHQRWYPQLYDRWKGKCPLCGKRLPSVRGYAEQARVDVFVREPRLVSGA